MAEETIRGMSDAALVANLAQFRAAHSDDSVADLKRQFQFESADNEFSEDALFADCVALSDAEKKHLAKHGTLVCLFVCFFSR